MKHKITKVQQGKGTLFTTIPKTITDILEIEKGTLLKWELINNKLTVTPINPSNNQPTLTKPDHMGVCYNTVDQELHILGIDTTQYNLNKLGRNLKKKYTNKLFIEDIPNDFTTYEIKNPDNIKVKYILWFEDNLHKSNQELIEEISEYKL